MDKQSEVKLLKKCNNSFCCGFTLILCAACLPILYPVHVTYPLDTHNKQNDNDDDNNDNETWKKNGRKEGNEKEERGDTMMLNKKGIIIFIIKLSIRHSSLKILKNTGILEIAVT